MRSAFTIATGKQSYKDMAINCARSFRRWNDLPFVIFSDEQFALPVDLHGVEVRVLPAEQQRVGFSIKLLVDRFAPSPQSLFLDADCLVMGDLAPLFVAFAGKPVGVLGYLKADGEMFGDVPAVCKAAGVAALARFNGGVYYIEQGAESAAIFAEARRLEPMYDELGLVRLRGQPNDEILLSIALAKAGVPPLENTGRFYADFHWWPKVERFDALKGIAVMRNPPAGAAGRQNMYPPADLADAPLVVHFLNHHVESVRYRRETLALRLTRYPFGARPLATLRYLPLEAVERAKDALRPLFHRLFGPRKLRRSTMRLELD